jgi:Ca2+-binding EF-hand superfamily protein
MKKLIAIAGSLALASGMAMAGDDMGKEKKFEDLDANQDGVITQSEASAHEDLVANFNSADSNADGYLTPSEFYAIKDETEEAE